MELWYYRGRSNYPFSEIDVGGRFDVLGGHFNTLRANVRKALGEYNKANNKVEIKTIKHIDNFGLTVIRIK